MNVKEYTELGKTAIDVGEKVVGVIQKRNKIKNDRQRVLSNKEYDMSAQYNKVILENFVSRKFQYYGKDKTKEISINRIKKEIESRQYPQKNIIIVGPAGVGKSMALKWLFLNSNARNCDYIYLYAKMFSKCDRLKDVFDKMADMIPADNPSIVFLDGLDEIKCIRGESYELQQLMDFFDQRSKPIMKRPDCKFVISTRPEHFEFNNRITNSKIENSLWNYTIYELDDLTSKESLVICKSVKKLWEYDQKTGNLNFLHKWPSGEGNEYSLTEKEYIRKLKEYIKNDKDEDSLLKSPLMCRYAYPIICGWDSQNKDELERGYTTQYRRIQTVLKACIKWEFHDSYTYQTEEGKGKAYFKIYKQQVLSFLTDIAGEMGEKDSIEKKDWQKLKNKNGIKDINRVYCGLQEDEEGNLQFIHQSFKNFFLARYYVLAPNKQKESPVFMNMLKLSSELAVMYVELLMKEGNTLAKKVCNDILNGNKQDIYSLSEYARGTLVFMHKPEISFTAAEFFSVFPNGKLLYAGIRLDKERFESLRLDGILKVKNLDILKNYTESTMSAALGISIKGLETECRNMRSFSFHFWIYENSCLQQIYGIQVRPLDPEKQREFAYIAHQEHTMIFDGLRDAIQIMGSEKRYWCFFDEATLFFYQMLPQNEEKMSALFADGCSKDPKVFSTFYGGYKAMISDKDTAIQSGRFSRVSDIPFTFCAKDRIIVEKGDPFVEYYFIHRGNLNAMELKIELYPEKYYQDETEELNVVLAEIIKNNENEKLKLYLADEQLLTYYILERGEKMVELAQETLELCKKYEHSKGIMFRELLIRDETCFNGDDLHKIYQFAKEYIWI